MLSRTTVSAPVRALLCTALLGLAACASEATSPASSSATRLSEDHAQISAEVAATAKVVAIDKAMRCVTLRGEDGRLVDVIVGSEARNFDQIRIGDQLNVRYKQTVAATRLPPGTPDADTAAGVSTSRAEKGQKPAGTVEATVSVRVKIVTIDDERGVVVFSLPSGELIAHKIATAEGHRFVRGLRVGDKVQLDFSAALALSVEAVQGAG